MSNQLIDLTGKQFGRLTVIGKDGTGKKTFWNCVCSCGRKTRAHSIKLRRGHVKSCGCLYQERLAQGLRFSHGQSESRTYSSWCSMIQRCTNPLHDAYVKYGARGIDVCPRWRKFKNFLADMGERPHGKSLDRIDNDRGYSPENCRWATQKEQCSNGQRNHRVEFDGLSLTVTQWAEMLGLAPGTLFSRLYSGWTIPDALNTPARPMKRS